MLGRIKFQIEPLVNEILDQLPQEVWTSKTTTFLDPAMGGGQFVREVERRLREAGHTDANISGRVYGCETSLLSVKYALNKYKLIGTYSVGDFLTQDFGDMKFDVVVGNPPYQSGNGEKGGRHSLWRKFVKKGFELVNKNGFVALICPGFPVQAKDLSECFTKNTPLCLVNDVTGHFPNVGSEIKYWVVREGAHNHPFYVDGTIWTNSLSDDPTLNPLIISILKKTNIHAKFVCKQDKGYNSTQFKNDSTDYFETPKGKAKYPIRHASTIKICYVSTPTECHFKNKVMMTFSGYPDFEYFDGKSNPMSSCYQMSGYVEVKNKLEGKSLIKVYMSKLYTFLSGIEGAGMKGTKNYSLPKVDLSVTWTDQEIYAHFGLTQEEIDYIEANVK